MNTYRTRLDSPLGSLWLTADDDSRLTGLVMDRPSELAEPGRPSHNDRWVKTDAPFTDVSEQLAGYFAGELTVFDLPLHLAGTPFQLAVWEALRAIGYGEVRSYREVAEQVGRTGAFRAVGAAIGRNPIAVIVPCHRVVGASGVLTGYAWGLDRKRALLDLEAGAAQRPVRV